MINASKAWETFIIIACSSLALATAPKLIAQDQIFYSTACGNVELVCGFEPNLLDTERALARSECSARHNFEIQSQLTQQLSELVGQQENISGFSTAGTVVCASILLLPKVIALGTYSIGSMLYTAGLPQNHPIIIEVAIAGAYAVFTLEAGLLVAAGMNNGIEQCPKYQFIPMEHMKNTIPELVEAASLNTSALREAAHQTIKDFRDDHIAQEHLYQEELADFETAYDESFWWKVKSIWAWDDLQRIQLMYDLAKNQRDIYERDLSVYGQYRQQLNQLCNALSPK